MEEKESKDRLQEKETSFFDPILDRLGVKEAPYSGYRIICTTFPIGLGRW
ncbi:hypothetical protein [Metallosphaera hakonensis]